MTKTSLTESDIQRRYYARTAVDYEAMHVGDDDEHALSLAWMLSMVDHFGIRSILDIGSGTGRAVGKTLQMRPHVKVVGVEPVRELREVGYANGIPRDVLLDGDALALPFADGEFDLVCEFAVLHHIKEPHKAVSEMLRVASKAVFISDSNNFGQGRGFVRSAKQALAALGLWRLAVWVRNGGKGYMISEGDGLSYSYSVFNNYEQVRSQCKSVHLLNLVDAGVNLYRSAPCVALLGIKK
jgi:SAM-dependent methyltransferase